MIRASILFLILGGGRAVVAGHPRMKTWLQATITNLLGKPVAFRALSLGGGLMVQVGQHFVGGERSGHHGRSTQSEDAR